MKKTYLLTGMLGGCVLVSGCAVTESSQALKIEQVASAHSHYHGPRQPLSIGRFDNRSSFMRGAFSTGPDRLGGQARTILETHLQQSNRFTILNRDNMDVIAQESVYAKKSQQVKGASFVITGDVTEFGRKDVGDHQLFGLLGRGKQQVAYAKVNLNVVDVRTSEVVYSTQGAGEFRLSNREVIGFGGTSSYDATLNGKVLDLAIREAVNRLAEGIDSGDWSPLAQQ